MLLPGSVDRHRTSRRWSGGSRRSTEGNPSRPWRIVHRPYAAIVRPPDLVRRERLGRSPGLGEELLPNFKETDFLMHFVEKPGTSLEAMRRITEDASKELMADLRGCNNFGSHIGRAEVADEVVGPNFTELWISIDEKAPYKATVAKVEDAINGYPGLTRDVLTYLRERIKEVLTGAGATIVVRLYGPDIATLRSTKAQEVYDAVHDIPGVANLKVEQQVLVPQLDVRLRPDAAARLGLTPGDVRRAATTLVKGQKVGELVRPAEDLRRLRLGRPRRSATTPRAPG